MSERDDDKVKILLVDDRRENLLALSAMLARPEWELVQASSGEEALDQVLRHDFAVILLDVAMPGMDGFETAELIKQRERSQRVPIIFVTASGLDSENVWRGYDVGAVDYLPKPLDAETVRAKVAVFVQLYEQARQIRRQGERLVAAGVRERAAIQRRAAEAIESSEELYRATFDQAPTGIAHVDTDGRLVRVNSRLCAMLGLADAELLGKPLQDLAERDDGRAVAVAIAALNGGARDTVAAVHRFRHHDGTSRFLDTTLSVLRDRAGHPKFLILVAQDITQRRKAEEALRASERRFSRLRDSGLIGVFYRRGDGTIVDANATFLELIGATRGDLDAGAINVHDLTPPEYDHADARAVEELRATGVHATYEKELLRKDGRRVSVLLGGAIVDGGEDATVTFVLDVSERKAIEVERTRLIRELREAVRARDDFLAIAAHELRTPLTPLRLQVDGLLRAVEKKGVEAIQPDRLAVMGRSLRRLEKLIANLLDVSRVTVGRLRLERERVDLAQLVRDIATRAHDELERARCPLTVAADQPVVGQFDRIRLDQVLTNLLSNAVKYGAGKPIEISVDSDGEHARVTVRDHGIGMPEEEQQRIFERFERLVPVRHYGGFGLGLWIVRQIVEAHGGTVDVWSKPGEGAKFTVELPLVAVETEAAATETPEAPAPPTH